MSAYRALSGTENEQIYELAIIRMILRQAECRRISFEET
jgi:hypothetical protein